MSSRSSTLRTEQHTADPVSELSGDTPCVEAGKPVFGEAEQLLLDEARQRFDFEQRTSAALQTKSALFLTLTGVFAAFITSSIGRLLDRATVSYVETAALCLLLLSLGILTIAAVFLARSALSRSYQVIASPIHWVQHLAKLKQGSKSSLRRAEIFSRLQQDILGAWVEAVEACYAVNESKAAVLAQVSKLICVAVPTAFLALVLLFLQRLIH